MSNPIDNAGFATRIRDYIRAHPGAAAKIAKACGVTLQAISAWKLTGRFDKRHLEKLAAATGRSEMYWLSGKDSDGERDAPRGTSEIERKLLEAWRLLTPRQQDKFLAEICERANENREAMEYLTQSQNPSAAQTANDVVGRVIGRPVSPVTDAHVAKRAMQARQRSRQS